MVVGAKTQDHQDRKDKSQLRSAVVWALLRLCQYQGIEMVWISWLIMINYYQLDDLEQLTLVSVTRDEWLEF